MLIFVYLGSGSPMKQYATKSTALNVLTIIFTPRLRKRVLELFGRITSMHQNKPDIWLLYADISPSYLLKAQRLLKAYKAYTLVCFFIIQCSRKKGAF